VKSRFAGVCYRCNKLVAAGDGHFERYNGGWRTQHVKCSIEHKKVKAEDVKSHKDVRE